MSLSRPALRVPQLADPESGAWPELLPDTTTPVREPGSRRRRRWIWNRRTPAPDAHLALNPVLVAALQPDSPQAEALRELRSQLLLRWFGGGRRTLAVVGARSSDGCSSLAANLAIVLAQLGQPTLLVDADLRGPRQQELFGLAPDSGVADLLRVHDFYERAVVQVPAVGNLGVLCAGAVPSSPQELVSGPAFIDLLRAASARFAVIVVDTPPVLDFADAQIIAARAGGCLLVTRRHRTRLADVEAVKERLKPTGAQVVGAVING